MKVLTKDDYLFLDYIYRWVEKLMQYGFTQEQIRAKIYQLENRE